MKVYFATPAHRMSKKREEHLHRTNQGIAQRLGLEGSVVGLIKDSPWIDCARADLVADFLRGPCDALFFRDDDIDLTPDMFARMLAADRPVVVIPYKTRTPPHPWAVTRDSTGRITHAGLGCALIQRSIIEAMCRRYADLTYYQDESPRVALFHHMILPWAGKRIMLKEDHAFFERLSEMGYVVDEVAGPISHGGIV
jgi:hypothetical protein